MKLIIMSQTLPLIAEKNKNKFEEIQKEYSAGNIQEKETESGTHYLLWNKDIEK